MSVKLDLYQFGVGTGLYDLNGDEIRIGDILSLSGNTDFETTMCGEVRGLKGKVVSFYGKDALDRDCFDELDAVNLEREIIGNTNTWEQA